MIVLENRIVLNEEGDEKHMDGYFLKMKDLEKLVRDFQVDCFDGFVSHDSSYIEQWLKNRKRE